MSSRDDPGPYRLPRSIAGIILVLMAIFGFIHGRGVFFPLVTLVFGLAVFIAANVSVRTFPKGLDSEQHGERRIVLTYSLCFFTLGALTLIGGIRAGGWLFAVSMVGFVLSIYLAVGMLIGAARIK